MQAVIQNQRVVKRKKEELRRKPRKSRSGIKNGFFLNNFRGIVKKFSSSRRKPAVQSVVAAGNAHWVEKRRTPPILPSAPPAGLKNRAARISELIKRIRSGHSRNLKLLLLGVLGGTLLLYFAAVLLLSTDTIYAGQGGVPFPGATDLESQLLSYLEPRGEWHLTEEARTINPEQFSSLEISEYTVSKGDTLSEIAKKFSLKMDTLISFNQINNVRKMQVGTVLKIPNRDGLMYRVKRGDSLSAISARNSLSINALLDANDLDSTELHIGQDLFLPGARMDPYELRLAIQEAFARPVIGRFTSNYGMRNDPFTGILRFHNGVDLANEVGTPIYAAMDGVVKRVETQLGYYGKYVIIGHPNGYQTLYAHLNSFNVRVGQQVSRGQKIGEMGNTGRSTGSHLHFSIFQNGKSINPLDQIPNLY